jgi:hypothetical protein
MTALDFPPAPAVNQGHAEAGLVWRWSGRHWVAATSGETPAPPATVVATTSTVLPLGFTGTVLVQQIAPVTITLPPTPSAGQQVTVKDAQGVAGTHPITVAGTIEGATNMTINFAYGWVSLTYSGMQWVQT